MNWATYLVTLATVALGAGVWRKVYWWRRRQELRAWGREVNETLGERGVRLSGTLYDD